ncbi:putative disease resistance protein [Salvia divinorum]|uniref:Disease resistance protein n=1 Tax=Salvia divinorum TaxID=28513 RepID=A0ABD1HI03_SALDI
MAEAVVSTALETIRDLLLEEGRFLAGVGDQVKELERQLKEMKCFLKDADKRRHESSTIFNWISEIRDLVYRSESAIERHAAYQVYSRRRGLRQFVRKYSCIMEDCYSLHQLGSEISQITFTLERISKAMQENGITRSIIINPNGEGESSAGNNMSRKTFPNLEMGDCFLGMEDEVEQLVHHLRKDTKDRIISVWGMGVSGKTAIAKKLYNETTDFDLSAWVCITQQCESRSVWEDVLRQLEKKRSVSSLSHEPRIRAEVPSLSNSELIERLCEIQREKRCLIVLDDVWELSHWDELKHPFIIHDLQSKILVTTRKQKVAEIGLAVEHGLLHMHAALELLKNKAFYHANISDFALEERFEKIGKEMVQKCGYLPLAISLLGGVLREKKSIVEWESVNEHIKAAIYGGDEKQIDGVLNLSYESLPYYLKPCFLYMGIFNEDETIFAWQLYKMWIAQGMISYENIGDKEVTLMDIAELYLSELASRSIVQVENFYDYDVASKNVKYETFRLHDVVRELCLKLGEREHFGVQSLEYQGGKLSTLLREASSHVKMQHLAIHFRSDVEHELMVAFGEDTSEHIRSVRLSNLVGSNAVEFPPQSVVDFQKFKMLRDLVIVRFKFAGGELPRGITKLVHLRCLRLQECELDKLPSSMRNLVYMDTLDLTGSKNVEVPNIFKKMLRLKNLSFPLYGNENIGNYRVRLDEGVCELETLAFFDSRCHELICIGRMKNLRYFVAMIHDNESLSIIMNGIMKWNKLRICRVCIEGSCDITSGGRLEKSLTCPNLFQLSIRSKLRKALAMCRSDLLSSNLRCLDLFNSEIGDDPMGILGKLPCLIRLR